MPDPVYRHVALIPSPGTALFEEVVQVAAAIQTQISKDLAQYWPVAATVFAQKDRPTSDDVWPIFIESGVQSGIEGYHNFSTNQPQSYVYYSKGDWSIAASHECIEMLVDHSGDSLLSGYALNEDGSDNTQTHVSYLVEACDPVGLNSYCHIGGTIKLSDFCTPSFYTDQAARPGVAYSHRGSLKAPRSVAAGGYLSWKRQDNTWYQINRALDGSLSTQPLGPKPDHMALRTFVDKATFALRHTAAERKTLGRPRRQTPRPPKNKLARK